MEYRKIPLEKQLAKAGKGRRIHPEYTSCAIRMWADMPIAAYLGDENRRKDFRRLLGITEEEESAMTYAAAMTRIKPWFDGGGPTNKAHQALRLLSAPLYEAYQKWEEKQNEKNTT